MVNEHLDLTILNEVFDFTGAIKMVIIRTLDHLDR
jgi:hypothetical protein